MHEAEARRRELVLTKLYARLNNRIEMNIKNAEGSLKTLSRKRTNMDKDDNEQLFDGIRDKKLKANWEKTPQPIVIKLMKARCMRDKIPKGEFVIRAGVLDRLVDNKMFYSFIGYGDQVKEARLVEREKAKRNAEELELKRQKEEEKRLNGDEES